jgi:hypothetical protein
LLAAHCRVLGKSFQPMAVSWIASAVPWHEFGVIALLIYNSALFSEALGGNTGKW